MWKLIFLVVIIGLAIHIAKRMINKSSTSEKQPDDHMTQPHTENMVQCASCAVHLPRSEAFLVNGNFYCCQTHIKK